jgi:AraC-like DNA-binding protein
MTAVMAVQEIAYEGSISDLVYVGPKRCRRADGGQNYHNAYRWRAFLNLYGFARSLSVTSCEVFSAEALLRSEAALTGPRDNVSHLRTNVENAVSSLLPHGRVVVDDVARSLGMTKRTLARRLSNEGLNFTEVLQQLRRDVAVRYLDDPKLHISNIAWLLGFNEVSAFTRAFKRWTGKTPSQMRIGRAGARPVAIALSAMASSSGEC